MKTRLTSFVLVKYVCTPPEHGFADALVVVLRRNDEHGVTMLINRINRDLTNHEHATN
jgi:hypothetical protein